MAVRVVTDQEAFRTVAANTSTGTRIPVELRVTVEDPFDAYRRARPADKQYCVYLETTGGQPGWGYFAITPVRRLQVGPDVEPLDTESTSLGELRTLLDGESLARGACETPYPCGAFGWLSYDVARELEALPEQAVDDRGLPHLQMGVYDTVVAWRADDDSTLRITSCPQLEGETIAAADAAYDRGLAKAEQLAARITTGDPAVGAPPVKADAVRFNSDCGRDMFRDRVRTVKHRIREGDTFQANVSQRLRAPAVVTPVEAFAALRAVNPAPYSALVEFPGVDLVSASPELLLDVDGDDLRTEPIAGTRPRGADNTDDATLETDLTGDSKERAEHAMLVDLERNDLGKVSRFGTVEVSEYRRVDYYSEVMHLVSLVEAQLRDDRDTVDAVAATFPGGTITGAPKPKTMEIIDTVETTRRGPYTGSIGVFGFDDQATLNIVIRTLVRHNEEFHLRVGAGIVHDSTSDREYDETLDKGRALVHALNQALGEAAVMRVDDEPNRGHPQ
jgi:anthranilate synthase component 1